MLQDGLWLVAAALRREINTPDARKAVLLSTGLTAGCTSKGESLDGSPDIVTESSRVVLR